MPARSPGSGRPSSRPTPSRSTTATGPRPRSISASRTARPRRFYPALVASERLSIAQVSPHPWGTPHEVNEFVARVSAGLAERGHRVVVAAPAASRSAIRESRRQIRVAQERPAALFDGTWKGQTTGDDGGPPVLSVGSSLAMPRGPAPRAAPVPIDLSRPLEELLGGVELDIVHVHDPFAPSAASVALRHSRSLNVGSFHEPSERILSTQVARPLVEIFFGRLDARTASSGTTSALMERFFPGTYELVTPGADREVEGWWPPLPDVDKVSEADRERPVRIAFCLQEERGALRLFLRALRRLPLELAWEVAILLSGQDEVRIARRLRDRVHTVSRRETSPEQLIAAADIACVASGGPRLAPGLVRKALASGTVPVASRVSLYEELVRDGERGLLFPPGDAITLAGQLERLIAEPRLRAELVRGGHDAVPDWTQVVGQLEDIYLPLCARRHDPRGNSALRGRLSRRRSIHVDLHMHTDHSPDCATPVEVLLATARDRGLGAIAITDHNEISGALAARQVAEQMGGIKVIVAEEVKTAEQGEVIGLFLEQKIPRGMTMGETIAEIRRQGGLVYVPHPFDRLHSVPDYEHLLAIVEEIDILEVFNPRVALTAFNEEAERFAAKYRIVPGAGSDSHVAQGLGSVMIRVHDFEGPDEFLEAMRDADIVRKHKNLIYVQALKLLQASKASGARRAVPSVGARPVKGGRPRTRRSAASRRAKSRHARGKP
jgi:predicted metal-dependent phosphoesterase TrpH/glycosyltransferase involved in cell wall biosynthesis